MNIVRIFLVDFICQETTQTYIYFSSEDQTQASTPEVSEGAEWTLESFVTAGVGPTIHSGMMTSTRSLRPGMKLKTTLSSDTKLHHWGVGYGGTTGLGNGPTNPFNDATGSWRSSNAQETSTFNTNYTAISSGDVLAGYFLEI